MRNVLRTLIRHPKRLFTGHDPRWDLSRPAGADAFARELGLHPLDLAGVILEVEELRPIVEAVHERRNGSLLVFGCGHDSVFWEKINHLGHTAFLEDDPVWMARTRARLRSAQVHFVQYATQRRFWRELLDDEDRLAMKLPDEVLDRHWDVIIVDAPAGFDDTTPGRMKSIYTASRLARPGTRIFVHDCERAVEDAFTSKYLGRERMFIEKRGRAILRGYSF